MKTKKLVNVGGVMLWTIVALIPAILTQIIFFGWGVLINLFLAAIVAVATESVILRLRRRSVLYEIMDISALLSAVILALCLPPQLAPHLVVIGTMFMMIFGKHIFGGLGTNPFNPAMLAYVMLLLSFPTAMTEWLTPDAWGYLSSKELIAHKFMFGTQSSSIDVYSSATALDSFRVTNDFPAWLITWQNDHSVTSSFLPFVILSIVYAIGGLLLINRRIISWHIPSAVLLGLLLPAFLFHLIDDKLYPPVWFHLILGGTVFGAFFIATDPVSAATNELARLVYGFGIGLFIFIIRTWGGYADAVAFAVLFFNFAAPFIDKYVKPRIYGH